VTAKELKKLAAACRKAGIKSYSSGDFSFTLTDDAPEPIRRGKATTGEASEPEKPESDTPTDEQILFWSCAGVDTGEIDQ